MPAKRPILVLQLQRMGDLVLTFPLLLWLARKYPGHPLWVMAEEAFYKELMPLGPETVYFPWREEAFKRLQKERFHLVLNLSHRRNAAELAGRVQADRKLGPVLDQNGEHHVHGPWQLYRSSLVRNNRHNLFHWADLNALDAVPFDQMSATSWPPPRDLGPEEKRVGLFLGASEAAKRPQPRYWAALAAALLARGLQPVLMGGPGEKQLGREVAQKTPGKVINICGELKLSEFATVGQAMQLLITPDTGPMHLAAWSGLKVLNLSMGPVNCWETGPYQPGHYILRASTSCVGCWECSRPGRTCRRPFGGKLVPLVAECLAKGRTGSLPGIRLKGLSLYRTARRDGLYWLEPVNVQVQDSARADMGLFWRQFWGASFGLWDMTRPRRAIEALTAHHPALAERLARHALNLSRELKPAIRRGQPLDQQFWSGGAQPMRPARGYLQMLLDNGDYSPAAWAEAMSVVERLLSLLG